MTKISSEEVRQKAVHAITRLDYSERQVAEIFGVSTRTIRRWVTQYREEGQLAPRPHGHKKALFSDEDVARAQELLLAQPDMTLEELRQALHTDASLASVCRLRQRAQKARKKRNAP